MAENTGNTTQTTPEGGNKGGEMIPKARFDEVYAKMKNLEREIAAVTQQYGVTNLAQVPEAVANQVLANASNFIVDMVRETGIARNVLPFFQQRGITVPEIEQLAQQMPAGQGDEMDDPYMSEIRSLKQKLEQMEQMTQQERQQQIQQILYSKMASAVQQVVPGAKGEVLNTLINIMADKAMQIVEGNPNLDWQTFVSQMDFTKMAQDSVGVLQQAFTGGTGAPGVPSVQSQQSQPTQTENQPTPIPGDQGPVKPDGDAAAEAEKEELFAAIAGEGEIPAATASPE